MNISKRIMRIFPILLFLATALVGCVDLDSQSIAILQHNGLQNISLQIGEEEIIELTLDPTDALLKFTNDHPSIVSITELEDNKFSIKALEVGSARIIVTAEKQGYKNSIYPFVIEVSDPNIPVFKTVNILPSQQYQQFTKEERFVEILIRTENVANDTLVKIKLVNTDLSKTATLTDNYAAINLTIPEDLLEPYQIKISADGMEPYLTDYFSLSRELSSVELEEIYVISQTEDYVAGEQLDLNIYLWQEKLFVTDNSYEIVITNEQGQVLYSNPACPFENGKVEVSLTSPITKTGEHTLIVTSKNAQYPLKIQVFPAVKDRLKLISTLEEGSADLPLPVAPTLVLVDEFGNIIKENGHSISVSTPSGFVSGNMHRQTNEEGVVEFDDLVLYEGEYTLTFSHEAIELSTPIRIELQKNDEIEEMMSYLIFNFYGLQSINDDLAAHYQLANTIDATSDIGFLPIKNFAGYLDGKGFAINNLFVDGSRNNDVGLFANIAPTGMVTDLALNEPQIHGIDNVGALAGINEGKITNCKVIGGEVKGETTIGGLIGFNKGIIERSFADTTTSAKKTPSYAGGLVGINGGKILYSYALGTTSGFTAGGLVGRNQNHGSGVIIESYAAGSLAGIGNWGGLIGLNLGSVSKCYFDKDISSTAFGAGLSQSTAKMKTQETFTDWNFLSIWDLDDKINQGYPFLRD